MKDSLLRSFVVVFAVPRYSILIILQDRERVKIFIPNSICTLTIGLGWLLFPSPFLTYLLTPIVVELGKE